jgi:two-component system, OmpR family, sensor histidine kinase KdpD
VQAETESLRSALLAAISHDFRTPLASIVGASSSLIDSETHLTESGRLELGKTIYEEARRMTRLANNLLDMARFEAGNVKLDRQWCPIEEVVGGVLSRIQQRILKHPITIKLPPGLSLVHADHVMLGQVLENLLENAVKYTPLGTPIEIGAGVDEKEVSFWVADRGPGLPEGKEDKLFEKFYRGTIEGPQSGVGLGLTICRAIVAAHGGQISAENRPEGGAMFRFTIPSAEAPPQLDVTQAPLAEVK